MLDCNISLREIANRLTKKLNPNKPFHHNQITKVVNKYKNNILTTIFRKRV